MHMRTYRRLPASPRLAFEMSTSHVKQTRRRSAHGNSSIPDGPERFSRWTIGARASRLGLDQGFAHLFLRGRVSSKFRRNLGRSRRNLGGELIASGRARRSPRSQSMGTSSKSDGGAGGHGGGGPDSSGEGGGGEGADGEGGGGDGGGGLGGGGEGRGSWRRRRWTGGRDDGGDGGAGEGLGPGPAGFEPCLSPRSACSLPRITYLN